MRNSHCLGMYHIDELMQAWNEKNNFCYYIAKFIVHAVMNGYIPLNAITLDITLV